MNHNINLINIFYSEQNVQRFDRAKPRAKGSI